MLFDGTIDCLSYRTLAVRVVINLSKACEKDFGSLSLSVAIDEYRQVFISRCCLTSSPVAARKLVANDLRYED